MSYRHLFTSEEAHQDGIWCVAWNNKSNVFLTGSVDSAVKVWKASGNEGPKQVHKFTGHRLGVISVDVDRDGKIGVSSSMDSVIRIWDLEKGKTISTIEATPIEAWTISLSPDGKTIAAGSQTGNVNIFNVSTGKKEQSFDAQKKSFCMAVSYSPCGRFLASGTQDGSVFIFDISTSKLVHNVNGHSLTVRAVKFSQDCSKLITCSDDKTIKMFDVKSGSLIKTLSGHSSHVLGLAVSPDGKHFASCSSDKTVKVWEIKSFECIHTFEDKHKDQVWAIAFNENGSQLVSVSDDSKFKVYSCPLDNSK
jgi:WD repeat-containing protein 61